MDIDEILKSLNEIDASGKMKTVRQLTAYTIQMERLADPAYKEKLVSTMKTLRNDPEYVAKQKAGSAATRLTPEWIAAHKAGVDRLNKDEEYRAQHVKKTKLIRQTEAFKQAQREGVKKYRSNPAVLEKHRARMKELNEDPIYCKKQDARMKARSQDPKYKEASRLGFIERGLNPEWIEKQRQRRMPQELYDRIYQRVWGPDRSSDLYRQLAIEFNVPYSTIEKIAIGQSVWGDKQQHAANVSVWKIKYTELAKHRPPNEKQLAARKATAERRTLSQEKYDAIYKLVFESPVRTGEVNSRIASLFGVSIPVVNAVANGRHVRSNKEQFVKDLAEWKKIHKKR